MHRFAFRHGLAVMTVGVACALFGSAAAPAPSEDKPKTDTPAEKIKKALNQPVDIDVNGQSIQQAISQLKEQVKIDFELDKNSAAQLGVDMENTPVTLKLKKVKLRVALRKLLGPQNLSYAVVGDVLLITTEGLALYRQLKQPVSVDLDRVQLGTALKQLARDTGANFVVDPKVLKEAQTPITLQLDDVPLETAVRMMAELAGLKPARMGNVLFVTTKANAKELRAEPELVPAPQEVGGGMDDKLVPGAPGVKVLPAVPAPAAPPAPKDKPADPQPEDGKVPKKDVDKNEASRRLNEAAATMRALSHIISVGGKRNNFAPGR
jgi:type II secretory pathway component GspD/PulD (secretin)